ncbi:MULTISPECIES: hypothetical protein [unclassified Sporosarcina]
MDSRLSNNMKEIIKRRRDELQSDSEYQDVIDNKASAKQAS